MAKYVFEGKTIEVDLYGTVYDVTLTREKYENNRTAIVGTLPDGEGFAVLSCNIPDVKLNENEVIIKNWSENEELAIAAGRSGFFIPTGNYIATWFVKAPVWIMKEV